MTEVQDGTRLGGVRADGVRLGRLGDDEVVVKRGLAEVRLAAPGVGHLMDRLLHSADGSLDADELTAQLLPEFGYADRVVEALLRREILHHGAADGPQDRFWASVAPGDDGVRDRLGSDGVRVTGTGEIADALRNALRDNGIAVLDGSADLDGARSEALWCAAADGPADPFLLDASRAALTAGTPFLPVWVEDLLGRVGPLTHPRDTACLKCYLWRLESNDPWRDARRRLRADRAAGGSAGGSAGDGAGWLPNLVSVLAGVAAGEVTMFLAGLPVRVVGRVAEVNPVPFGVSVRRVLKVPRCPDCSRSATRGDPVLTVGSQLSEPSS